MHIHVKTLTCIAHLVFLPSLMVQASDAAPTDPERVYRVEIHVEYDPALFFPPEWIDPTMELVAEPIHPGDAERLSPVLEQFMSSHPRDVINDHLEHIYLLGKLRFKDRDYGGTHHGKNIYIVWDRTRKYDNAFVLRRLHSEFSSILQNSHPFPEAEWMQLNPEGFSYTGTGFEMLGQPDIYTDTEKDSEDGFLYKYSRSSLENDFNMIAAELFTEPGALDQRAAGYPALRGKISMAKDFYRSLSSEYVFR